MERSISLLTFKGSISEAIIEAKKQKKLFVVYVSGEDGDSNHLEKSTWMDLHVADSMPKYCIFLHLIQGSIDASNFSAIYPQKSVPCITAIGYNGVQLWQHEGYISSEDLVSSIEKEWLSLHIQETTATVLTAALSSKKSETLNPSSSNAVQYEEGSPSSSDIPSSSTDESPQESVAKSLLISELTGETRGCDPRVESREASSELIHANELESGECEESASPREMAIDSLSPAAIDPEILEVESTSFNVGDRCTSSLENSTLNDHSSGFPQGSSRKTDNGVENSVQDKKVDAMDNCTDICKSNDVHLHIRLPDGASLQNKFSVTDTLRLVKDYVDENQTSGIGSYDLAIPYPRKVFNEEDLSKALLELGLFNRQALIVVPRHPATGSHRGQSVFRQTNSASDVDLSSGGNGGYFGYVKRILSYINPFSYLGNSVSSSSSEQASNDGLWQYRPSPVQNNFSETERTFRPYSPNSSTTSTSENASKSRKPTTSHFGGNIHTLKRDEDDSSSKDRNTFWNGNSTQYGGNDNGK